MKFVLTIDLGNEAMLTRDDVKRAIELSLTSKSDYAFMALRPLEDGDHGNLHDGNGNSVGEWEVTPS